MMRTIKEIELAALTLRAKLRDEGKDPLEGVFHVTMEEWAVIMMEPFNSVTVGHVDERFCGLKLKII
jgi:hypothetical protein